MTGKYTEFINNGNSCIRIVNYGYGEKNDSFILQELWHV